MNDNPTYGELRKVGMRSTSTGSLFSGPFSNQESCLIEFSQFVKWSSALEMRRPLS